MLYSELTQTWLKQKADTIKQSTFSLYAYEINHYILPYTGNYDCRKIDDSILNELIRKLKSNLKCSTVNNIISLIRQINSWGISINKINRNSLTKIKKLNYHTVSLMSLSDKNISALTIILLERPSYRNFGIYLALQTGLRIGEVSGLKWKDFDIESGYFKIERIVQRISSSMSPNKTILQELSPKTFSSTRIIPLTDVIINYFNSLQHDNGEYYVLTNSEKPFEPRSLRRYYCRLCSKNNIVGLKFHSLRHTFATNAIKEGIDCKIVSDILGHSNVSTTLNLYVHPDINDKRRCLEKLQNKYNNLIDSL